MTDISLKTGVFIRHLGRIWVNDLHMPMHIHCFIAFAPIHNCITHVSGSATKGVEGLTGLSERLEGARLFSGNLGSKLYGILLRRMGSA